MHDALERSAFRSALAGAAELPSEVGSFALDAAERIASPERIRPTHVQVGRAFGGYQATLPPPWPDGPLARVNQSFIGAVTDTDTLDKLIDARPTVARQVLLACLIEEPVAEDPHSYSSEFQRRRLDLNDIHSWYPPLYLRGSFLLFLRRQPCEGLEAIIRLVNFAVGRWAAYREQEQDPVPTVRIELQDHERTLIGDFDVYMAYRDHGPWPHSVVVALMALEKWMYDQMELGAPLDETISTILSRTNSVAFAAVLMIVGTKYP